MPYIVKYGLVVTQNATDCVVSKFRNIHSIMIPLDNYLLNCNMNREAFKAEQLI